MKNYIKKGQKLPLYGVGPMIVFGMGAVTAIGIILFAYVWKIGVLEAPWALLCRIAGALLISACFCDGGTIETRIPEHGLLWTLIVCPIAGLAVAGLNRLF